MALSALVFLLLVQVWLMSDAHSAHDVALHKPVMSSGDGYWPSSNAIDGNLSTNSYAYCIETNYSIPSWWRVDLESIWQIEYITIYFRTSFISRRNGIQVYVTDSTEVPSGDNCYNVTGSKDGSDIDDVLNITCSARGRYVILYTDVENESKPYQPLLDFCEVQVYGTCSSGMFGPNCNKSCHCQGETCDPKTGVCPGGACQPGWRNQTCDTECPSGTYGDGCSRQCSSRYCDAASSSYCDHVTGNCSCSPGYSGIDCTMGLTTSTTGANINRVHAYLLIRLGIIVCMLGFQLQ